MSSKPDIKFIVRELRKNETQAEYILRTYILNILLRFRKSKFMYILRSFSISKVTAQNFRPS